MDAITPKVELLSILAGLAAGDYGAVELHLFKNDISPTPSMVLGDFTEADFGGYAQFSALDFGAPYINTDGFGEMDLPSQQWNATGVAPANNVYGYWVEKTGGGLLFAARFDNAPIPMIDATNAIVLLVRYVLRNIGS